MTMTKTRSRKVLWLPLGPALRTIAGPDQDPVLSLHIGLEAPAPLLEDDVTGAPAIAALDLHLLLDPIETTIHTATEIEVAMKIAADPDTDLQTHQVD